MPCHRMMLALSKYRLLKPQTGWRAPSTRAAEDVQEEVGTPSFTLASLFVALVPLMLPPIAHLRRVSHPI